MNCILYAIQRELDAYENHGGINDFIKTSTSLYDLLNYGEEKIYDGYEIIGFDAETGEWDYYYTFRWGGWWHKDTPEEEIELARQAWIEKHPPKPISPETQFLYSVYLRTVFPEQKDFDNEFFAGLDSQIGSEDE